MQICVKTRVLLTAYILYIHMLVWYKAKNLIGQCGLSGLWDKSLGTTVNPMVTANDTVQKCTCFTVWVLLGPINLWWHNKTK